MGYFSAKQKAWGAPSNFAYYISFLGNSGTIFSRVGNDDLGKGIIKNLLELGLNTNYIQIDTIHPTGKVDVYLDRDGQPDYIIN